MATTTPASEAALRTALTTLADRYEEIAARATTDVGRQRAQQIRKAAEDIRRVLTTGRLPLYLTSTEPVTEERAS